MRIPDRLPALLPARPRPRAAPAAEPGRSRAERAPPATRRARARVAARAPGSASWPGFRGLELGARCGRVRRIWVTLEQAAVAAPGFALSAEARQRLALTPERFWQKLCFGIVRDVTRKMLERRARAAARKA